MKKTILTALITLISYSALTLANSDDWFADDGNDQGLSPTGYFVSLNAGLNLAPDHKITDIDNTSNWLKFSSKTGYNINPTVGYRFNKRFHADLSGHYIHNGFKALFDEDGNVELLKGKTTAWAALINGYYNVQLECKTLKPYIGVGIGFIRPDLDIKTDDEEDWIGNEKKLLFAYSGSVGAQYAISKKVALNLQYRYLGSMRKKVNFYDRDTSDTNGSGHLRYQNHLVNVGLVYYFDKV